MTVQLRGHHLLCMLTYIGKGYSPAFVENYDTIAGRLSAGEDIILVAGPDDICAPLLCSDECHCLDETVQTRDGLALQAISRLLSCELKAGMRLTLDNLQLRKMRTAFADGTLRDACNDCEWSDLCSQISVSDNYSGVLLTLDQ